MSDELPKEMVEAVRSVVKCGKFDPKEDIVFAALHAAGVPALLAERDALRVRLAAFDGEPGGPMVMIDAGKFRTMEAERDRLRAALVDLMAGSSTCGYDCEQGRLQGARQRCLTVLEQIPAAIAPAEPRGEMPHDVYYLNDKSETHWEICHGERVEKFVEKTSDDGNRGDVERMVRDMNRTDDDD